MSSRTPHSSEPPARNDLAEGFASHLRQWAEQAGAPPEALAVLAAAGRQVSLATQAGHVCTPLEDLVEFFPDHSADQLSQCLLASQMVVAAGKTPTLPSVLPLVLDRDGRLYLHRYFAYERRLAASLGSALCVADRHRATSCPIDSTGYSPTIDSGSAISRTGRNWPPPSPGGAG
jgi:hypothetical protein